MPMVNKNLFDLCSGIGGFSLAFEAVGFRIVAFAEIEPYCCKVLKNHWPDVPNLGDIRNVTKKTFTEPIAVLTAGTPCQPFSVAGKRRGKTDDRYLWPEVFRVVRELRPRWCCFENVPGIVRMALDDVLSDLESENYTCGTLDIPACAVNAPHRRARIWIVANKCTRRLSKCWPEGNGGEKRQIWKTISDSIKETNSNAPNTEGAGKCVGQQERMDGEIFQTRGWEQGVHNIDASDYNAADASRLMFNGARNTGTRRRRELTNTDWQEPWPTVAARFCRVDDGVPHRIHRLKCLGNAIVPQVAFEIAKAIKKAEDARGK